MPAHPRARAARGWKDEAKIFQGPSTPSAGSQGPGHFEAERNQFDLHWRLLLQESRALKSQCLGSGSLQDTLVSRAPPSCVGGWIVLAPGHPSPPVHCLPVWPEAAAAQSRWGLWGPTQEAAGLAGLHGSRLAPWPSAPSPGLARQAWAPPQHPGSGVKRLRRGLRERALASQPPSSPQCPGDPPNHQTPNLGWLTPHRHLSAQSRGAGMEKSQALICERATPALAAASSQKEHSSLTGPTGI